MVGIALPSIAILPNGIQIASPIELKRVTESIPSHATGSAATTDNARRCIVTVCDKCVQRKIFVANNIGISNEKVLLN
jgi:hypothetical protein